jgi:hypothetical protein
LGIHSHQYINSIDNVPPAKSGALEQSSTPVQGTITLSATESEQNYDVQAQHDIALEPDTEAVMDSPTVDASVTVADSLLDNVDDYLNVIGMEQLDYTRQVRRRWKMHTVKISPIVLSTAATRVTDR